MINSNLNIKKLSIRLKVLLNEVVDFNRGSYFGVRAMDAEVLHLWEEYNNIWELVVTECPSLKEEFPELSYPDPYIANGDSFYKEGTMIYKPEHFAPLRLSIQQMLKAFNQYVQKESA
ncbi:MAG: hypothetical protein K9G76_02090 [Bacteroidales bacterium]|nr:hypothetical protein [Bacteroidales bacterium]MCF8405674.1 hypothetical protein [Bacteroidales bacterium]